MICSNDDVLRFFSEIRMNNNISSEVMNATDKARELLSWVGYNAALGVARAHRGDIVDDTTAAYWDRVIAALEASRRPDSATILQFPEGR